MWIKICGLTDCEAAEMVAAMKPDAVGLNFHAGSPRAVQRRVAAEIVRGLPEEIAPIGVFVNAALEEILATCRECALRGVQLHGDEPPQLLARLQEKAPAVSLIRAFRLGADGMEGLERSLESLERLGVAPAACLVDAHVPGAYGGTGRTAPWELLATGYRRDEWPPLVLAGGLKPENVAEAIRTVRPWGVDVASGVESAPGRKDSLLVERFLEEARTAERLGPSRSASETSHRFD